MKHETKSNGISHHFAANFGLHLVHSFRVLLWNGSVFSASASELGDVDGDGSITVQDACWILETYAKISAGIPTDVPSDLKITADVDDDGMISVQDAVMVLQYYAKQAAGIPVSWNILKMSQVEQDAWTRSQETLQLINEQRAANGLSNLTTSDKLYEASSVRAKEIADTFSHTRPNGDSAFTVLDSMDIFFMCAGENIAMGFPTPKSVVTGWMNSPGHRANILGQTTPQQPWAFILLLMDIIAGQYSLLDKN